VEVLAGVGAGHDRQLGRFEIEGLDPAGLDECDDAERLDGRAQGDDSVRVTQRADESTTRIRFHDVAAVEALLDPIADLPDEHRRVGSGPVTGPYPTGPRGRALRRKGHQSRIPRRDAAGVSRA